MANYDKDTKTWRVELRLGGRRVRKRGFLTRQLAEAWEMKTKLNFQRGLVDFEQEDLAEIGILFDAYLGHAREYKTPKSAKRDESTINHFRDFFHARALQFVGDIPENTIKDYLAWRKIQVGPRGTTPCQRTLNLEMETVKKIFAWGVEEGLVKKNPFDRLPLYKQRKSGLPRYLTIDEIKVIEENAPAIIKTDRRLASFFPCFSVLVRTGMRSDELCRLEVRDVDLERRQILLRPETTKAGYQRAVPIADQAAEILAGLIDEARKTGRTNVVKTTSGKKQTTDNLGRRFRGILIWLEKEGLLHDTKPVSIHTLRRTYISHLIMAGTDPATVMAIVGHKEWATIQRYLVLAPDHVSKAGGKLPY